MLQYLNAMHAVSPHLLACFLLPTKQKNNSKLYNLQKGVISTQKQPTLKKVAALCKMATMKKAVKCRCWPKNGCDGRSVTKNLATIIQVNFVPIPNEAGMR